MQLKLGTYTGDGSDNRALTGVGFQPDALFVKGGSNEMVLRTSTMSGDKTKQLATAAALAADMVQSLASDGFTVGTNARVNANGTVYYYLALRDNGDGDLKVGTFTGDGLDNRNITGVGFQPTAVWTMADAALLTQWNFSGADSSERADILATANLIQSFASDGFQIGSSTSGNTNGAAYHYLALKDVTGVCKVGSYTGNGVDSRSITGVGFQPDFAWVSRHSSTFAAGVVRFKDNVGDDTPIITAAASAADRIQAFESDGFQVGQATNVNVNTSAYLYLALKETAAGSTPISQTDVASGADAVTLQRQSTSAETAAGVDAASVAVSVTVAETGSGVDAVALEQQSTVADVGSGTDVVSVAAALSTDETSMGADDATLAISATVTDTGVGVDAVSASADTLVDAAETASGLDAVLLEVAAILADAAAGVDDASVAVALTVTDTATATDAALKSVPGAAPATRASASDSAYGGAVASDAALVGAAASDSEV